jgi:hypothetical protein
VRGAAAFWVAAGRGCDVVLQLCSIIMPNSEARSPVALPPLVLPLGFRVHDGGAPPADDPRRRRHRRGRARARRQGARRVSPSIKEARAPLRPRRAALTAP